MMINDKVCIIGAGASGMAAAKTLKEYGVPFDCFEMGSDVGGNWRYNNDNGRSAAYDSLTIDTSKDRMQFSDFPMPASYPTFPHHAQILAYFEEYVAHFDLRPTIQFCTEVTQVAPAPNGGYHVTYRQRDSADASTTHYRAVLVCNGHHWNPQIPQFPGQFHGETLHSRNYRQPHPFTGQNVLVVGIGNSGVDIACEVAEVANRVYLSTRRGAHILPRFVLGRPIDKWVTPFSSRLPTAVQTTLLQTMINLDRGPQEKFGIPKPHHKLSATHGTVSADLPAKVATGAIQIMPNIQQLHENSVTFTNDATVPVDTIIYATGYQISFPFLPPTLIQVTDNVIPLYHKVIHPDIPHLYFIGLLQPLGPIMPLSELQAQWVAQLLTNQAALPSKAAMQATIAADQAALRQRYLDSTRHTIQVDFFPYIRTLQEEMKNGRNRATTPHPKH